MLSSVLRTLQIFVEFCNCFFSWNSSPSVLGGLWFSNQALIVLQKSLKRQQQKTKVTDTVSSGWIGVNWQVLERHSPAHCKQLWVSSCLVANLCCELGFRLLHRCTELNLRVLEVVYLCVKSYFMCSLVLSQRSVKLDIGLFVDALIETTFDSSWCVHFKL